MSDWITFLGKYYRDRKKTDPGYSYKHAMVDASKEFKKTSNSGESCTQKSRRTKSSKSRKSSSRRLSRRSRRH